MEPQVGNKIRIKHNLLIGRYGTNSVVEEMQRYKGQIATIENSVNVEREIEGQKLKGIEYIIDLDNGYYSWTKDMFSMEIKDEDLFNVIEETIGVNKKEIEQDYKSTHTRKPTEQNLIDYARDKFKDFL